MDTAPSEYKDEPLLCEALQRKPDRDIITKTKTIAELNNQLKSFQVELETMTLKNKKLV